MNRQIDLQPNGGQKPVERILSSAPTLSEAGITVLSPKDRPDKGRVKYSTLESTLGAWAEDPFGEAKLNFISQAYGIEPHDLEHTLDQMGLSEWLKAKKEGRFIGMVSTQVLKPTHYFLSNAIALGRLAELGIPTALMIGTYDSDIFATINSDKGGAFGTIDFFVGMEDGKPKTVKIKLVPTGIRESDGRIRPIKTIDDANGVACDRVIVKIDDTVDPAGKKVSNITRKAKDTDGVYRDVPISVDDSNYLLKTAFPGLNISQEGISLTDFYKQLFQATIDRLRTEGVLPSEDKLPIIHVSAEQMYGTLAAKANLSNQTREILGTNNEVSILKTIFGLDENEANKVLAEEGLNHYMRRRGLNLQPNGVLVNDRGMMDPSIYYALQFIWPDLYLECSSCGGEYFDSKISRADQLLTSFGIHTPEVRLPDKEVPTLETLCILPSTGYYDLTSVSKNVEAKGSEIIREMKVIEGESKDREKTAIERKKLKVLQAQMTELRDSEWNFFRTNVMENGNFGFVRTPFSLPPEAAAVYNYILGDAAKSVQQQNVQTVLSYLRNR